MKIKDIEAQDLMHQYYHAYCDTECDENCPRWRWVLRMAGVDDSDRNEMRVWLGSDGHDADRESSSFYEELDLHSRRARSYLSDPS